eukprot:TRINITY_DN9857_c0_g3_i1.p1 TRINITY_DN9857_c0_g3~~TRINITY_DN9857_c0_g3_i1.p1  ORF type:complete len:473 (-),score=93.80 TRINITY_DN9857_c0_g3_i1:1607-3025(-)
MKVQKSGSAYAEAAVDEIHLLTTASTADAVGSRYVVKLLDNFQVSGPNGIHHCMIFELLGDNLLALIRNFSKQNVPNRYGKGIPIPLVRRIAREVLHGLDYLHRNCHIIHTDLKPENILLQKSLGDLKFVNGELAEESKSRIRDGENDRHTFIKVVDLGNACWTHKHFTDYITTRQYRSPEAIVELHYSSAVDIWSLACIVFELITGDYLFEPRADKNGAYSRDEDHLALMMELLGDAPEAIKKKGRCSSTFFTRNGTLRNISDLVHWPLESLLQEKVNIPKPLAKEIASFLAPMLEMDPSRRATAAQCLRHPFVALPEVNHQQQFSPMSVGNDNNSFLVHQNYPVESSGIGHAPSDYVMNSAVQHGPPQIYADHSMAMNNQQQMMSHHPYQVPPQVQHSGQVGMHGFYNPNYPTLPQHQPNSVATFRPPVHHSSDGMVPANNGLPYGTFASLQAQPTKYPPANGAFPQFPY